MAEKTIKDLMEMYFASMVINLGGMEKDDLAKDLVLEMVRFVTLEEGLRSESARVLASKTGEMATIEIIVPVFVDKADCIDVSWELRLMLKVSHVAGSMIVKGSSPALMSFAKRLAGVIRKRISGYCFLMDANCKLIEC